jgi:hypothetical protein
MWTTLDFGELRFIDLSYVTVVGSIWPSAFFKCLVDSRPSARRQEPRQYGNLLRGDVQESGLILKPKAFSAQSTDQPTTWGPAQHSTPPVSAAFERSNSASAEAVRKSAGK